MFQKSLPIALVAIAGCVALAPNAQKTDTVQSASPAPTAQATQKASPTPVPISTPTPTPSPTPVPTPLPKNILKLIIPRPSYDKPSGLEGIIHYGEFGASDKGGEIFFPGIALSASGDMYIQVSVSTDSIPVLCPACDMNVSRSGNYGIFRKTDIKDEFEFVAMAGRGIWGKNSLDPGKTAYLYERQDFAFSKLTEAASVSVAPWVVKSVNYATKTVSFDTAVWPQNTGPLVLSNVANGDFFGRNIILSSLNSEILPWIPCSTSECEDDLALTVVRERTAFTGTTVYFIGREDTGVNTTIFRVNASGTKEVVGKKIAAYFADPSYPLAIHNFVYCQADRKFYITVERSGYFSLYRVSEDALVP